MYPSDLDDRFKKYLQDNNETWNPNKHHIYIKVKNNSELLVIHDWKYKCKPLTPAQLDIPKLKVFLRK